MDNFTNFIWGQNMGLQQSANQLSNDLSDAYDTIAQYKTALANQNARIRALEEELEETDDLFEKAKNRARAAKFAILPLIGPWVSIKMHSIVEQINNGVFDFPANIAHKLTVPERRHLNMQILVEAEWHTLHFTLKHNITDFMLADVHAVLFGGRKSELSKTLTGQYPKPLTDAVARMKMIDDYNKTHPGRDLNPPEGSVKHNFLKERITRWKPLATYESEASTLPMFEIPKLGKWLSTCPIEQYYIYENDGKDLEGNPYTAELISHPLNPVNMKQTSLNTSLAKNFF